MPDDDLTLPGLEAPPAPPAPPPVPVSDDEPMTARQVKDALRGRHPASSQQMPGEWTCLEEWNNIDFLAWSAWRGARRVGYEVKVSRSDYRRELLRPSKRTEALDLCHEFYFAVPKGLLTKEELAYEESLWDDGDFQRERCPSKCEKRGRYRSANSAYLPSRGTLHPDRVPVPIADTTRRWWADGEHTELQRAGFLEREIADMLNYRGWTYRSCPDCGGKGYVKGSRVEREAPTLWIPRDVGLVEVTGAGVRVVRKAPKNHHPRELTSYEVGQLVRWVSVRPDPRHHARELQEAAA